MSIKERRIAKNMTQKDLASALHTNQNNISRYESGKRSPSIRVALQLAQALGCSIEELLRDPEEESNCQPA